MAADPHVTEADVAVVGAGAAGLYAALCASREGARLVVNLPPRDYLALLGRAAALVGNSSSGIIPYCTAWCETT